STLVWALMGLPNLQLRSHSEPQQTGRRDSVATTTNHVGINLVRNTVCSNPDCIFIDSKFDRLIHNLSWITVRDVGARTEWTVRRIEMDGKGNALIGVPGHHIVVANINRRLIHAIRGHLDLRSTTRDVLPRCGWSFEATADNPAGR